MQKKKGGEIARKTQSDRILRHRRHDNNLNTVTMLHRRLVGENWGASPSYFLPCESFPPTPHRGSRPILLRYCSTSPLDGVGKLSHRTYPAKYCYDAGFENKMDCDAPDMIDMTSFFFLGGGRGGVTFLPISAEDDGSW